MSSKLLSRDELELLIRRNSASVTLKEVEQTDKTSPLWAQFNRILVDNILQNFVVCIECRKVVAYRSATGTGGLIKHSKSCRKQLSCESTQSKMTSFYDTKHRITPENVKKQVTDACASFVLLNSRPFKIVSDIGLCQLLETVYNAGKYSTNLNYLNFSDVLPHPTTVRTLFQFNK